MMARWILLRGLARDSRHWEGFQDILAAAMHGDEVIPLDLAGNGARGRECSPAGVSAMVEDYRRQLGRRGLPVRKVCLLGLSLGGMVAIEWARRHPDEVERVVLVNSSAGDLSPWFHRVRPGQGLRLVRALAGWPAEGAESAILEMTSSRNNPQLAKKWATYHREHPTSRANAVRQLVSASAFRLGQSLPAQPVLLLVSAADRLVNPDCSRAIAQHTGWPLIEHPSAGHDLPLDDPAWVTHAVATWVRGAPVRESLPKV